MISLDVPGIGTASFVGRLKQAILVGLRLFVFCDASLVAVAAVALCVLYAIDPHQSAITAARHALGFIRIPFGVTLGLCIFFAAVSWNYPESNRGALETKDLSAARVAIHRPRATGRREVS